MTRNVAHRYNRGNRFNKINQNGKNKCYFPLWLAILVFAFFISIGFLSPTGKRYQKYQGNETIVFQNQGREKVFVNFTHPNARVIVSRNHYHYPDMSDFDWFIAKEFNDILRFYDLKKIIHKMKSRQNMCNWKYISEQNYDCECLIGFVSYPTFKSKYASINFVGAKKKCLEPYKTLTPSQN